VGGGVLYKAVFPGFLRVWREAFFFIRVGGRRVVAGFCLPLPPSLTVANRCPRVGVVGQSAGLARPSSPVAGGDSALWFVCGLCFDFAV
jgi:hypothetical protein